MEDRRQSVGARRVTSFSRLRVFILLDFRARRAVSFWNPIVRFQIALRVYEYLVNSGSKFARVLFSFYFRRVSIRLGFSIPPNVFGPGLCIVHYGTIVVSPHARVGRNCRLHAGVNIGGKAGFYSILEASMLSPSIGSGCYIGPGAKIFGPVTLGKSCTIGANAVVNRSFGPNSTLVGVPAREVVREN